MDVGEARERRHPSSVPGRPRAQRAHTITVMNMTSVCCCCFFILFFYLHSLTFLPSSGVSGNGGGA